MLEELANNWALFGNSYLTGVLIAALLGLLGVIIVARQQIFLGAAISQASTLGIAVALWLSQMVELDSSHVLGTELPLILAAALGPAIAILPVRRSQTGAEALTGLMFLLCSSLSMLLLSFSPHGLEEVSRIQASSIIGASREDVLIFFAFFLVTLIFVGRYYRQLVLGLLDPEMSATLGINYRLWETIISVWIAVCVGVAIRVAGVTFAFGCLVLPSLICLRLLTSPRSVLRWAPVISASAATVAFVLSNWIDLPPGQVSTAILCLLMLAGLTRRTS